MKYDLTIPFITLLTAISCYNKSTDNQEQTEKSSFSPKENIIKKSINIPRAFNYLTNMGSIDIIYTQGNYSIDVEGDSSILTFIETDFDSNLLTVSIKSDNNPDINLYGNTTHVKMHLSCPDLQCVSICGNGGFESRATWKTENLQLGAMGTGTMALNRIECTTFSIQSTSPGSITIADLHADDATIYSRSSASIDAHVNVQNLTILNDGTQQLKLTGKATNQFIKQPNDPNLINDTK